MSVQEQIRTGERKSSAMIEIYTVDTEGVMAVQGCRGGFGARSHETSRQHPPISTGNSIAKANSLVIAVGGTFLVPERLEGFRIEIKNVSEFGRRDPDASVVDHCGGELNWIHYVAAME